MPIAHFQLPKSLNYDFTKIKDYLQTGIVGCLTHSPHVTRLSNLRIKIFFPSALNKFKCKNVVCRYICTLQSNLCTLMYLPSKHLCTIFVYFSNVIQSIPFFDMFLLFHVAIYLYLQNILICINAPIGRKFHIFGTCLLPTSIEFYCCLWEQSGPIISQYKGDQA